MSDIDRYFSGELLYGDDFTPDQIAAWMEDEREGYAQLGAENRDAYRYMYHALNRAHGFRHLPRRRFDVALGLGAAYGEELRPVVDRVGRIVIVEPSSALRADALDGVPLEYREPLPGGDLPCEDGSVDLVTCFGVLHHIPTVSHAVRELARVLRPGGYALVREPIVSMGDWRRSRRGLTRRERGIPLHLLRGASTSAGLEILRETPCFFPVTRRLSGWANARALVALDRVASRLTAWNVRYHATHAWQKIAPSNAFLVLRRAST